MRFLIPMGSALLLAVLLASVYFLERRPETTPVAAGLKLAEMNGCFACHGRSDSDERMNFRSTSSGAMRPRAIPSFWENGIEDPEEIKEWIREGHPEDEAERHQSYLIQMPAYGYGFLDEEEIDAIAAWILAEGFNRTAGMGNAEQPMPELSMDAVGSLDEPSLMLLGDRLSRQQGCYQCHGQLGQGGVGNPRAFKTYIPGFAGKDFLALTDGGQPEEVLHWIDHGRGRAIESGVTGPLAKRYFDRQAIGMPAYEDLLSESEKAVLVDYLLLLNKKGPMAADAIAGAIRSITDSVFKEQESSE